jgi:hypothetical protein
MLTRLALSSTLVLVVACGSTPVVPTDWQGVAVVERNREGEEHLALPTSLPGCKHLGHARVSIPEGVPGVPTETLDTLKQKAARMGGNMLVLLPGRRVIAGTLRGSVFHCQEARQGTAGRVRIGLG